MEKPILEVHITIPSEYYDKAKELGNKLGYKASIMDGDPVLGPGKNCYLSRHGPFHIAVMDAHMRCMLEVLNAHKIPVKRYKIEQVLLDEIIPPEQQNYFTPLRTN